MKPYLLLLVALLLLVLFAPACVLTTLIRSVVRWKRVSFFAYTGESALALALAIDQLGNVMGRDLLELLMTRRDPARYRFGVRTETISAALGHNKVRGSLSGPGKALAGLLNFIDPGHCERAAGLVAPAPHPLVVLLRSILIYYGPGFLIGMSLMIILHLLLR